MLELYDYGFVSVVWSFSYQHWGGAGLAIPSSAEKGIGPRGIKSPLHCPHLRTSWGDGRGLWSPFDTWENRLKEEEGLWKTRSWLRWSHGSERPAQDPPWFAWFGERTSMAQICNHRGSVGEINSLCHLAGTMRTKAMVGSSNQGPYGARQRGRLDTVREGVMGTGANW